MSLSENTDSAILLVSSPHGRGVIEIWTRDEINNLDLRRGGGQAKHLDHLGNENSNVVMHTRKP